MIRVLRRTSGRTSQFLGDALAWRAPDRQHALVAWCLIAGAAWFAGSLAGDPVWPGLTVAGLYLLAVLAAVCAFDARYGIIPNSLVGALAVGGMLQTFLPGQAELLQQGLEAMLFLGVACLFRRRCGGSDGSDAVAGDDDGLRGGLCAGLDVEEMAGANERACGLLGGCG